MSNLSVQAYSALRKAILERQYTAGAALSEKQLADAFGMSRTPVRQALQELVSEGFVEFVPSRGYFIPRLTPADIRELFELRESLEGFATRSAALRASEAEIQELELLYQRYHSAQHLDAWVDLGTRFHNRIISLSGNSRLMGILDSLKAQISLTRHSVLSDSGERREEALADHRAILDAIRQRDADQAELQARAHVRRSYEVLLRNFHL